LHLYTELLPDLEHALGRDDPRTLETREAIATLRRRLPREER
jgi:hypothetical protein